jgi:citrate lyase subunit beta/citryl-CoA lyase
MVALTLLYAPADRPDLVRKALLTEADAVVIDLEDAVAASAKDRARRMLPEALAGRPDKPVQIRVNAAGSAWVDADLNLVAGLPGDIAVRLPKAEDPAWIREVSNRLGGRRRLHLLIESARGVEAAYELASASGQVSSIGVGDEDLRSDLGLSDETGLQWARSRVVNAARAAGLPSPIMSVFASLTDMDGLTQSCRRGARLGFVGRAAIHPRQLPVIRAAFAPAGSEVAKAATIIRAVEEAAARGIGTVVLPGGEFLDAAMVERARKILGIHALSQVSPAPGYPATGANDRR